jgi:hypothetical protein
MQHCTFAFIFTTAFFAWGTASASATETALSQPAVRPWRIVVNDDGDFELPADDPDLEKFLDARFNATVGTQVDAYFLNIGSTDRLWEKSKARPQDAMSQWAAHGDVPDQVDRGIRRYIDAAHDAGMQVYFAMRLNDIHDAWHDKLTYPLKAQRPDLLLGRKGMAGKGALLQAHWSGFDWSQQVVRDHFCDFILWAAARWNFDGVELDWFRHPMFFKPGEEQANVENVNDFVRQVRRGLNAVGRERQRPCRLTTRVPDTPHLALLTGFDVEQWLKEGLLDMLMVGGGYMPYGGRLQQFIDMAHRYGVHAYPCMNHYKEPQIMRSVAAGFWALGADGFYLFNYGGVRETKTDPRRVCLDELGDPSALVGLDKRFVADTGCSIDYVGHTNPPSQFPRRIVGSRPVELVVGDDLGGGSSVRATLVVKVADVPEDESIAIRVNGRQVPADRLARPDEITFCAEVDPGFFTRGINHIQVVPGPGSLGGFASAVTAMELLVDYDLVP